MLNKGRKRIFAPYKPTDLNSKVIANILADAFPIHLQNAQDIEYLHRYRKGYQPVEFRKKDTRPEICNKICENHAEEIVTFYTGYIFGSPVTYVTRSKDELNDDADAVAKKDNPVNILNTLCLNDNKPKTDRDLGEWIFEVGVGYKATLPLNEYQFARKEKSSPPFHTAVLDPRTTFCVYSTDITKTKLLSCSYSRKQGFGLNDMIEIVVYTDDSIYIADVPYSSMNDDADDKPVSWQDIVVSGLTVFREQKNMIGINPIVEYTANPNRMGMFEPVMSMLDALNEMASSRADGVSQFVQSFVKFINCDVDEDTFTAMRQLGAIKVSSSGQNQADVDIITSELNQDQTQTFVEDMYNKVLAIAGVPDRRASAGGNTGQALIIGQGWTNAESRAQAFEQIYCASEKETILIALKILKGYPQYKVNSLETSEVEVTFTRNRTDNMLNKTQALLNMLNAGLHPLVAIDKCDLFSDPEKVYSLSKDFIIPKWDSSSVNNNGITDPFGKKDVKSALNAERDYIALDTTNSGDNNAQSDAQNKSKDE